LKVGPDTGRPTVGLPAARDLLVTEAFAIVLDHDLVAFGIRFLIAIRSPP
jgi:hypothetical protein